MPMDQEFTLAAGEVASLEGARVRIQFLGVEGDSRCPADAFCIQGGDALVKIEVHSAARTTPYDLHTGDQRPVKDGDLTIALVRLDPYPFGSQTIQPRDYRATLRVTN